MLEVKKWLADVLPQLKQLVSEERRIGVEILELLDQMERRKAYSELGYDGLFSFCVHELGFTESQAYQRIQAMRAVHVLPELKTKIESGVMSVTTVAQVQGLLRKERAQGIKRTIEERRELFKQFEGKTMKEVKKEIAEITGERIRLRLVLEFDAEAEALWREVKEKSAHQTGGDELSMMKMLMRGWLGKKEKKLGLAVFQKEGPKKLNDQNDLTRHILVNPCERRAISRYIPMALRREVFKRDQGKCTKCGSRYALQYDHIEPFAKLGQTRAENLRLLCRSCNLGHGVRQFGVEVMRR